MNERSEAAVQDDAEPDWRLDPEKVLLARAAARLVIGLRRYGIVK